MKRTSIITTRVLIGIMVVCLTAGIVARLYWLRSSPTPMDFLPANILCYFHHKQFGSRLEAFLDQPLGRAFKSIRFAELALDLGVPFQQAEWIRDADIYFNSPAFHALRKEFFNDSLTLALLPGNTGEGGIEYLKKNCLAIGKPQHNSSFLIDNAESLGAEAEVISILYGKHQIYRLKYNDNLTATVAYVGDKMVAALEERTLRRALDRYDDGTGDLKNNRFFAEHQKQHGDSHVLAFVAVDNLREHLRALFGNKENENDQIRRYLTRWRGITAVLYSGALRDSISENLVSLYYNRNMIGDKMAKVVNIAPEKDQFIAYSPYDTLLYYWTNTFDLDLLWNVYAEESRLGSEALLRQQDSIAAVFGMPFEELLGLVGNNIHIMVRKPSPVDLVPLPNFTLAIELNERNNAQEALQHFVMLSKIPHNNDVYRGVHFSFWGEAMQNGLQPVYSIYKDRLFISSSIDMQLDVINTMMDGNRMIDRYQFRRVGEKLLMDNTSNGYIHVGKATEIAKKLLRWVEVMTALQGRETAYKSKQIIQGVILPLLGGMKNYSSLAMRTHIGKERITIDLNVAKSEIVAE